MLINFFASTPTVTFGSDEAGKLQALLKVLDAEKVVFEAKKDDDDDADAIRFELTADGEVISPYWEAIEGQLSKSETLRTLRAQNTFPYKVRNKYIRFEDQRGDGTTILTISPRNSPVSKWR